MLPNLLTPRQAAAWEATDAASQRKAEWRSFLTRLGLLLCGAAAFFLLGMAVGKSERPAVPVTAFTVS